MSRYTPREYADMHFVYGECRGVGREAARLYRERYPDRRHPDYRVFGRVHNAYTEGRIPGTGVGGASEGRPQVHNDEEILNLVDEDPSTSVRVLSRRTGISTTTVHRIRKRHELYPYHYQRVQSLLLTDMSQAQDSSSEKEIKVFCPKCNTEVPHTADGIQQDQTKALIAKVYHYLEQEYEELKQTHGNLNLTPLSKFRKRTALATGVSETTLLQILKEEEERNADRTREPREQRAARRRHIHLDSSSEESSSDSSSDDDDELPIHTEEVPRVVVKQEPPDNLNSEEPEIFVPRRVKLEPSDRDTNNEQADPISVIVKTEPRDEGVNTTEETPEFNEPAGPASSKRRKLSRMNVDTSTRSQMQNEPSTSAASRSNRRETRESLESQMQNEPSTSAASRSNRRETRESLESQMQNGPSTSAASRSNREETRHSLESQMQNGPSTSAASRSNREETRHSLESQMQNEPSTSAASRSNREETRQSLDSSFEEGELKMELEVHEEGFI